MIFQGRRKLLLLGGILGTRVLGLLVLGTFTPLTSPADASDETVRVLMEQYRRYGSEKQAIEADADRFAAPETAHREISYRITNGDLITDVSINVGPPGEDAWYEWSSADGKSYTLTNHRTGETRSLGASLHTAIPSGSGAVNWLDKLTADGWSLVTSDGRAAILQFTSVLTEEQEAALSSADSALAPVGVRHEIHLDLQSNLVTENHRFLVDENGRETLVEYFKILEGGNE